MEKRKRLKELCCMALKLNKKQFECLINILVMQPDFVKFIECLNEKRSD